MSTTIETTSSFWRKRLRNEDSSSSHMDRKRLRYYYRLESESSRASEDDTESVYSLQGKETDIVRDSSDTDTNLEVSEYEVESFSENEIWENSNSSSGSEDLTLGHLVAAAQAMYDSSIEKWITDCEESDNSSLDDSTISRSDFSTCTQCKSLNVNPQYRYCEKCYQQSCRQCKMRKTYKGFPLCISCHKDRKKFFPPRPRGNKKAKNSKKKCKTPVKLEHLKSALSGLSQDSGIGSSQEMTLSFPCTDDIILTKEYLKSGTSDIPSSSTTSKSTSEKSRKASTDELSKSTGSFSSTDLSSIKNNRKRYISESSLSDFEIKRPKIDEKPLSQTSDLGSEISTTSFSCSQIEKEPPPTGKDESFDMQKSSMESVGKSTVPSAQNEKENSEMCIICNNAPKDSIFLHTNIAHQCCCYRCAKRTLHTIKRCPICNRSVNKVVKIYTS